MTNDWRLITLRIRQGDADSFSIFYDFYFDFCFQTTSQIVSQDEATTLDIVQEVMMKVISNIPKRISDDEIRSWLYRVCKNRCLDWIKHTKRDREKLIRFRDTQRISNLYEKEDKLQQDRRENLEWIETQLSRVPEETQEMLRLRFENGWTLQRIAKQFGQKVGAVDGKIRRLIQSISREFRKREIE